MIFPIIMLGDGIVMVLMEGLQRLVILSCNAQLVSFSIVEPVVLLGVITIQVLISLLLLL